MYVRPLTLKYVTLMVCPVIHIPTKTDLKEAMPSSTLICHFDLFDMDEHLYTPSAILAGLPLALI